MKKTFGSLEEWLAAKHRRKWKREARKNETSKDKLVALWLEGFYSSPNKRNPYPPGVRREQWEIGRMAGNYTGNYFPAL